MRAQLRFVVLVTVKIKTQNSQNTKPAKQVIHAHQERKEEHSSLLFPIIDQSLQISITRGSICISHVLHMYVIIFQWVLSCLTSMHENGTQEVDLLLVKCYSVFKQIVFKQVSTKRKSPFLVGDLGYYMRAVLYKGRTRIPAPHLARRANNQLYQPSNMIEYSMDTPYPYVDKITPFLVPL